jgi:hypothetical protein
MFRSSAKLVSHAHLKYQEPDESAVLEMNAERDSIPVVPKMGSTALCGVGLPRGALKGKEVVEVDTSQGAVRLFTIEVNLDQTLGNWYHFTKPTHCIKNLLTLK